MSSNSSTIRELEFLVSRPKAHIISALEIAVEENCLFVSDFDSPVFQNLFFSFLAEYFGKKPNRDNGTENQNILTKELVLTHISKSFSKQLGQETHLDETFLELMTLYDKLLSYCIIKASPVESCSSKSTSGDVTPNSLKNSNAFDEAEPQTSADDEYMTLCEKLPAVAFEDLVHMPKQEKKVVILATGNAFMTTVTSWLSKTTALRLLVYPTSYIYSSLDSTWTRLACKILWSSFDVLILTPSHFSSLVGDNVLQLQRDISAVLFAENESITSSQIQLLLHSLSISEELHHGDLKQLRIVGWINPKCVSNRDTKDPSSNLASALGCSWLVVKPRSGHLIDNVTIEYSMQEHSLDKLDALESMDIGMYKTEAFSVFKLSVQIFERLKVIMRKFNSGTQANLELLANDVDQNLFKLKKQCATLGPLVALISLHRFWVFFSALFVKMNGEIPEALQLEVQNIDRMVRTSISRATGTGDSRLSSVSVRVQALWGVLAALHGRHLVKKKARASTLSGTGFSPEQLFRVIVFVDQKTVAKALCDSLEMHKRLLGLDDIEVKQIKNSMAYGAGAKGKGPMQQHIEGNVILFSTLQRHEFATFSHGFGEFGHVICFCEPATVVEASLVYKSAEQFRSESICWFLNTCKPSKAAEYIAEARATQSFVEVSLSDLSSVRFIEKAESDIISCELLMSQTSGFLNGLSLPFAPEITHQNAAIVLKHCCERFSVNKEMNDISACLVFGPLQTRGQNGLYGALQTQIRYKSVLSVDDIAALQSHYQNGESVSRQSVSNAATDLEHGAKGDEGVVNGEFTSHALGYAYCIIVPAVDKAQPDSLVAIGPIRGTKKLAFNEACLVALHLLAPYFARPLDSESSLVSPQVKSADSTAKAAHEFQCTRVIPDSFNPKFWKQLETKCPFSLPFNPFGWDDLIGDSMGFKRVLPTLFSDDVPNSAGADSTELPMGLLEEKEQVLGGVYLYVTLITCNSEIEVYTRSDANATSGLTVFFNENFRRLHGASFDNRLAELNHYYEFDAPKSFTNSTSAYEPRRSYALLTRQPIHAHLTNPFVTWLDGVLACKTRVHTWYRADDGSVEIDAEPRATLFSESEFKALGDFQLPFWDTIGRKPFVDMDGFKAEMERCNGELGVTEDEFPIPQPAMFFVAPIIGHVQFPKLRPGSNVSKPKLNLVTCNQLVADSSKKAQKGTNIELVDVEVQKLRDPVPCIWDIDWLLVENVTCEQKVSLYNLAVALIVSLNNLDSSNAPLVDDDYVPKSQSKHCDNRSYSKSARWSTFDRLWSFCKGVPFVGPVVDEGTNRDITTTVPESVASMMNAIVCDFMVETSYNKQKYQVREFRPFLKVSSAINGDSSANIESFQTYYTEKYDVQIQCTEAGFILAHQTGHIKDGTQPVTAKKSALDQLYLEIKGMPAAPTANDKSPGSKLLLEFCSVLALPKQLFRFGLQLPSIIERIQMLATADQLRRELAIPNVMPDSLLEALTCPSTEDFFNYERLEILGDTVLKYLTTLELFLTRTKESEGSMTSKRGLTVSNSTLCAKMLENRWQHLLFIQRFRPLFWAPPGRISHNFIVQGNGDIESHDKMRRRYRKLVVDNCPSSVASTKRLADCFEALLGAISLDAGLDGATEFVVRLKMLSWPEPDLADPLLIPPPSLYKRGEFDLELLEDILQYSFRHPALAVQSFTHSKCAMVRSHSYERLEFLGDAVLDLLMVRTFYLSDARLSPEKITKMKHLTVSNDAYARLAVSLGLERFVKAPASVLREVEAYVHTIETERAKGLSTVELTHVSVLAGAPKVLGDVVEALVTAMLIDMQYNLELLWQHWKRLLIPFIEENAADLTTAYKNPIEVFTKRFQSLGGLPEDIKWRFSDEGNAPLTVLNGAPSENDDTRRTKWLKLKKESYKKRRRTHCELLLYEKTFVAQWGSTAKGAQINACVEALAKFEDEPNIMKRLMGNRKRINEDEAEYSISAKRVYV